MELKSNSQVYEDISSFLTFFKRSVYLMGQMYVAKKKEKDCSKIKNELKKIV